MGPPPSRKIREAVLNILTENPKTIKDIAKEAKTTRITAKKHLEALKKVGEAREIYRSRTYRLFVKQGGKE